MLNKELRTQNSELVSKGATIDGVDSDNMKSLILSSENGSNRRD